MILLHAIQATLEASKPYQKLPIDTILYLLEYHQHCPESTAKEETKRKPFGVFSDAIGYFDSSRTPILIFPTMELSQTSVSRAMRFVSNRLRHLVIEKTNPVSYYTEMLLLHISKEFPLLQSIHQFECNSNLTDFFKKHSGFACKVRSARLKEQHRTASLADLCPFKQLRHLMLEPYYGGKAKHYIDYFEDCASSTIQSLHFIPHDHYLGLCMCERELPCDHRRSLKHLNFVMKSEYLGRIHPPYHIESLAIKYDIPVSTVVQLYEGAEPFLQSFQHIKNLRIIEMDSDGPLSFACLQCLVSFELYVKSSSKFDIASLVECVHLKRVALLIRDKKGPSNLEDYWNTLEKVIHKLKYLHIDSHKVKLSNAILHRVLGKGKNSNLQTLHITGTGSRITQGCLLTVFSHSNLEVLEIQNLGIHWLINGEQRQAARQEVARIYQHLTQRKRSQKAKKLKTNEQQKQIQHTKK